MKLIHRAFRALSLLSVVCPTTAFAFGEDVCLVDDGSVVDCQPIPPECLPLGTSDAACKAAFILTAAEIGGRTLQTRSTIHADATHLLAQVVGFSEEDAYWIAAYDMATDQVFYEPWGLDGEIVDPSRRTADIDGVNRTGFTTGGVLFHFVLPRNGGGTEPDPEVDGLHPDVSDGETEVLLAHTRNWVIGATGDAPPLCAGGLTNRSAAGDYASGEGCFHQGDGAPAPLVGELSALAGAAVPIVTETGLQTIQPPPSEDVPAVFSDEFDEVVGGDPARVADARLGIYLHALADRVSHHVCTDRSVLSGPSGPDRQFFADMTNPDCVQTLHALRHGWETGVDYDALDPRDRTTEAALHAVLDELLYFAKLRGVLPAGLDAAAAHEALIPALLDVLGQRVGGDRILGVAQLACELGVTPFPGSLACGASG